MSDQAIMRARLQTVAAYRELCRAVQRGGRENVVFALIMLGIAYYFHSLGAPLLITLLYAVLAVGELLVGLFKWAIPSAEGVLLDSLVLLVFAGWNLGWQGLAAANGRPVSTVIVFLGLYMLFGAFARFKNYGDLRRLFAVRPDPEHIAWFDDLVREIQVSDPLTDELALDLPTQPHWKAKLLGTTVFFVASGGAVWVAGPDEFVLRREKTDHGTGRRRAHLSIHGEVYPDFEISDASWANYTKWLATQSAPQATT